MACILQRLSRESEERARRVQEAIARVQSKASPAARYHLRVEKKPAFCFLSTSNKRALSLQCLSTGQQWTLTSRSSSAMPRPLSTEQCSTLRRSSAKPRRPSSMRTSSNCSQRRTRLRNTRDDFSHASTVIYSQIPVRIRPFDV